MQRILKMLARYRREAVLGHYNNLIKDVFHCFIRILRVRIKIIINADFLKGPHRFHGLLFF